MQAIIEYLKTQKQRQDALAARITILEDEETREQEADAEFSRELEILLAEINGTEPLPV
ncbi:hypothetical protein [Microcoleus sp.]|uniref:hypothetical protein n=1 Tax=Microcoleus sp. TaxID=44472 RepID=UPI003525C4FC